MTPTAKQPIVTFSPELRPREALCAYWLRQVTLRLRREVCWIWHVRGLGPQPTAEIMPPSTDPALESLDLARYHEAKKSFFSADDTAHYLSEQIASPPPEHDSDPDRGSFAWVVRELALDPPSAFALALALSPAFDSAAGSVIGACSNNPGAVLPDLALAQRLWDEPEAVSAMIDGSHVLYRFGLLQRDAIDGVIGVAADWRHPLFVPALVARRLLGAETALGGDLKLLSQPCEGEGRSGEDGAIAARLATVPTEMRIIPVIGSLGSNFQSAVADIASRAGRKVAAFLGTSQVLASPGAVAALATYCWLRGVDLYLNPEDAARIADPRQPWPTLLSAAEAIPICLYLAAESSRDLGGIRQSHRLPALRLEPLSYDERRSIWRQELAPVDASIESSINECSFRYRFEAETIRNVAAGLSCQPEPVRADDLKRACRAELDLDLGELAEPIDPRFGREDLVLPEDQTRQIAEIRLAMGTVSRVHHEWGTARAWNEAGLAVLFAGPPGTGKSMAAEVLARDLDLPLYRIDLSQVVNKYIGETEKNLKRVFDACEKSDLILLFDEADAIFGKRTQVRDAHDRYANLEISYLLGRMEKAKGLTILATNRKEDLDDAFLRRLRYVVDFPVPGPQERRRIWDLCIPEGVDGSSVDYAFLADRFPLSGGHIRSATFNALLQSAGRCNNGKRQLHMEDVLVAVWRELRKASRSVSPESFGHYASLVRDVEAGGGS